MHFLIQTKSGSRAWNRLSTVSKLNQVISQRVLSKQKEYEEKLRESEEKYRKIVETTNEGICVTDTETIITYVNDRMAEMLGYSHEEMIGRLGTDFVDEKDNAIAKLNLEKRLQGIDDTHEFKYIRKDGSHLWALVSSKSLFDEDGKFTGSLNMLTDITDRKQLEEQIHRQAEELATVMETTPVAIWIGHDPQSHIITGNRMANELYETEEGENVSANVTPVRRFFCKDRELTADELPMQEASLNDIDVRNVELDVLLPSGKRRVILGSASPLHDAYERVRGSVGAFIDITERKQAEKALRESEKRYRALFDKSMDAIILTDPRGVWVVLSINPAACQMLGWAEEELIGKGLDVVFDMGDPALSTQLDKHMLSGSAMSQLNYRRKDGTTLTGEISSTFFIDSNGEPRMVNIIRDITERKQAEEALRQSEQHYRLLFETMLQGVVYQDANGKIISMNPAAERILGKTTAEFLGSSSEGEEHYTIREDGSPFPGLEHPAMVSLRTGREVQDVVMGVYNPRENCYRWININAVPIIQPGEDKPFQVYTLFNDITESKRAGEALQESETRYGMLFDYSLDAIILTDPRDDGKILSANPAACRLLEWSEEELIGKGRDVIIDLDSALSILLQYFTNWIRKSSSFIPISKYFSVKCLKS